MTDQAKESVLTETQKKEEAVAKELSEFLKERSAKLSPALVFPIYNKLPIELELALAVVQKHEPDVEIKITIEKTAEEPGTVPLAPVNKG